MGREGVHSNLQLLLNKYFVLFGEKPPKGFGKFFGERNSKPSKSESDKSAPSNKSESSETSSNTPKSRKPDYSFEFNWTFGSNKGSDGKQSGGGNNSEGEKRFTLGMIGSAIGIAAMSYYGYSYQEISWKDLTT